MTNEKYIEKKFWKALKADMTVMLGLVEGEDNDTRPMTAQIEDDSSAIWFFTATDTSLARHLQGEGRAAFSFASKDHEVFASVHGTLVADNDRAMIDRLWNPFVAAWYSGGKDDPKLLLLRFDPAQAEIWLNERSLLAGIKILFGMDPKQEYQDKVARVNLN